MEFVIFNSVVFLLLACTSDSRSVGAARCPTRSAAGRKDFILHDLGKQQPRRGRRATVSAQGPAVHVRRHDDDRRDPTSRLHILNAFTSDLNVSVTLKEVAFSNLSYGDIRTEKLGRQLVLSDEYGVSAGNESYMAKVLSSATRVPAQADFFLVTEESYHGEIHDTLSVWDRQTPLSEGCFWLLSHNAFSHSGVDVLLFDASKVGTDHYSLHRIGTNIEAFDHYFVELEEATYEVKVVVHNVVKNIDDFKNTPSLTPPLFIHPKAGERYYAAVTGIYLEFDKFKPDYMSVPALPKAEPAPYHLTNVIVVNAFPNNSPVEIKFTGRHHFKQLDFGQIAVAQFNLQKFDAYKIQSIAHNKWFIKSYVRNAVPYINSECIVVADMGASGVLENVMWCGFNNPPTFSGNSRITTYHALNNFSVPVDVLLFDSSKLGDPNHHSLYSIANHLSLGEGVHGELPEGNYQVKVFRRRAGQPTVTNSAEFEKASSLLPDFTLRLVDGEPYYLVLSGIFHNRKYPPKHIIAQGQGCPSSK